jgi:hypothetical protein
MKFKNSVVVPTATAEDATLAREMRDAIRHEAGNLRGAAPAARRPDQRFHLVAGPRRVGHLTSRNLH